MSRVAALLIALLGGAHAWNGAAFAKRVTPRVVGLLKLPEVVGEGCGTPEPKQVNLYDRASKARLPIGTIGLPDTSDGSCTLRVQRAGRTASEMLPANEAGYELSAAIVYAQAGRWFRVALLRGSAWVERDDPHDFLPYPQLLTGNMAFLRAGWDGVIRNAPGENAAEKALPAAWKRHLTEPIPITLLATRRVGSDIWLHLRIELRAPLRRAQGSRRDGAVRAAAERSAWLRRTRNAAARLNRTAPTCGRAAQQVRRPRPPRASRRRGPALRSTPRAPSARARASARAPRFPAAAPRCDPPAGSVR